MSWPRALSLSFAVAAAAHAIPFKDRTDAPAPALADGADIEERLGQRVPLELPLTDWRGRATTLQRAAGGKPIVLVLAYYRCPALCPVVLSAMARTLRQSGLSPEDYAAITVSIDPTDAPLVAAERRRGYLAAMGRPDQSEEWPFLVGEQANVRALADAVGFRYRYDEQLQQYAHASVAVVLAPDGRVSRYWYGIDFSPRDLRLSLVEAAGGRVGTSMDRVLLTCLQFDPASRRYGWAITAIVKGGSLLVFGALATLMGVLWRRELRGRA